MISPATLKKYKLDSESLRKLFESKKPSDDIKRLVELLSARNRDGIERCLKDHRRHAAADLAYNPNSHQETPAIMRHILSSCGGNELAIGEACKSWGIPLSEMFTKSGKTDGSGNDILELNPPIFHEVELPVVSSYLTIRTAKIFNDRNVVPLHKYEPGISTGENRVRCDLLTNLIEAKTAKFGYASTLRQVIFQTNHYSDCMMFPMEPWHEEKQEGEDGKETTEFAGVRYITPHKSRYWYDMSHPLASFNTDTGGSFAGYFAIQKWGDVDRNKDYWNRDKVGYGTNWLDPNAPYHNYFKQAYPCVLKFPVATTSATDRETIADRYTSADNDRACFLGYQFAKLVPKDWGLGDYKHPVWFRFIMAGGDTIIWADAYSYRPTTVAQYDADQNSGSNASMTTQVRPFQILMENLVTQLLLTIKKNLAAINFYDSRQIQGEALNVLQRNPSRQYSLANWVAFDGLIDSVARKDHRAAIYEFKYAPSDTSQLIAAFNIVNGLLERSLVISPQEIGATASHQQSVKEIVTITTNTNNRVAYTASFIDDFMDAWMRQLYEAEQAHGNDEIIAQVSGDIPDVEKHLKALGFEITGRSENGKKLEVKGKKNALRMESFVSRRAGPERKNDMATAQAMMQSIMSLNQNQMVAAIADPASVLELMEQAAILAGADPDFKIRINKDALKSETLKQTIGEIQKLLMQQVEQSVAKPAAEAIAEQDQKITAHKQEIDRIAQMLAKLQDLMLESQSAPPLQLPNVTDLNANPNIATPNDPAGIPAVMVGQPAI